MSVLVLNCGSSSVRFQVIATDLDAIEKDADRLLARGHVARIGGHALVMLQAEGRRKSIAHAPLRDHRAALDWILRWVVSGESGIDSVSAVSESIRATRSKARFVRRIR